MAKLIFSPLIADARGKAADAVFSSWKGRPYIRQRVIPANPQSPAQVAVRNSLAELVVLWRVLPTIIIEAFTNGAKQFNYSGYNDYMKLNRAAMQAESGLFAPRRDLEAVDPYIQIPTDFHDMGEPAAGEKRWEYTDPAQGVTYRAGLIVYNATDNVLFVATVDNNPMVDGRITIGGLTIGKLYLMCAFVYRNTDDQVVHMGTHAWTQIS